MEESCHESVNGSREHRVLEEEIIWAEAEVIDGTTDARPVGLANTWRCLCLICPLYGQPPFAILMANHVYPLPCFGVNNTMTHKS